MSPSPPPRLAKYRRTDTTPKENIKASTSGIGIFTSLQRNRPNVLNYLGAVRLYQCGANLPPLAKTRLEAWLTMGIPLVKQPKTSNESSTDATLSHPSIKNQHGSDVCRDWHHAKPQPEVKLRPRILGTKDIVNEWESICELKNFGAKGHHIIMTQLSDPV
ncbi:hypothetical protein NXS19_007698 [Fusarium pseudograminearum]|nr:hypothetical protein NXS19_007698 [Fusarium pseudograminearum]